MKSSGSSSCAKTKTSLWAQGSTPARAAAALCAAASVAVPCSTEVRVAAAGPSLRPRGRSQSAPLPAQQRTRRRNHPSPQPGSTSRLVHSHPRQGPTGVQHRILSPEAADCNNRPVQRPRLTCNPTVTYDPPHGRGLQSARRPDSARTARRALPGGRPDADRTGAAAADVPDRGDEAPAGARAGRARRDAEARAGRSSTS